MEKVSKLYKVVAGSDEWEEDERGRIFGHVSLFLEKSNLLIHLADCMFGKASFGVWFGREERCQTRETL